MAAAAGDYKVVRLLLERGVDCNTVIGYYGTALKAASRFGNLAIVALLLDFSADHTIVDGEASYTALQAAVMAESLSCVRALLDHGANIDLSTPIRNRLRSSSSKTTTLSLAVDARVASISVLLIEAGAQIEETRDSEQPLLIKACSWGDISVVQSLLKSGADVRVLGTTDSDSREVPKRFGSALHAAIECGHVHLIELLVTHGLCVTADCGTAGTPLEYALSKADIFVVAALLKLCPLHSGKPFVEAAQKAILLSRLNLVKLVCEHARGILTAHDVLLMCKTSTFATQCSIVWYLLERLRQLNGSARQFAEAVRHFMRHAQTTTALQMFTHAEKFMLSRDIWNVLEQACLRSSHQFVILLIETLQGRPDFDLELEIASTDVTGMLPEHVETLLSYVPCTHAMFIEACVRGNEQVVRIGLRQGLASDHDDGTQRPALHFAAAHERTVIVKLLLEERPWSHGRHAKYGTPIEAVLMSCASDSPLIRRSLSEKESRYLQDLTRRDETDYMYSQLFTKDLRRDAACKEIMGLLLEHESHRSPSEGASGSTFLELSLAACLGWRDVLRQLLMRGTPIPSCRDVLISPLPAAINGDSDDSLGMVKEILEFDKSLPGVSFYDPEGQALHHACRGADLPIVDMLLSRGYSFAYKNGEGQSALTVCLERVAESFYVPGDPHLAIVHTLLERDDVSSVSAEDIVAACGIALGREQNAIFQTLFARWKPFYIPEEGIIRLLSAEQPIYDISDEDMLRQRVFDERRIEKLTANLFAGVGLVDVLTKLLDYDQSFVVGTDIIDLVGTRSRRLGRQSILDCVAKLLDRCPDLIPIESNVVRVLQVGDTDDASHILKMLFARNPALMVTELMLRSCRNSVNLQLLLSRGKTEDHGLTLSLMDALVEESKDWRTWDKSEVSARFAVLLDQVPCAKVPCKVIEHIMESNDIGNIGRILDRDPDTSLTGDVLSAIIKAPRTVALHLDVVDFLRKYQDRYSMSDVHLAVGNIYMYSTDDELRAKKLYFELPGW
jgi:ankyrin repeat protein